LELDLATADDGGSVVVKIYSDLLHWKLEKELYVYDLMRRHSVRVPVRTILAADDSKTSRRTSW
jgi:hypothetical protein